MSLRLIATGGTFDKHYDEITGSLSFAAGHVSQAIRRARITVPTTLEELPFLDSLDMGVADRERILEACIASEEAQIVIVHGTDTMRETAEVLGGQALNKTIVLTGAMIPYEITNSDALFNLGFAVAIARTMPAGVYVAMNGNVFPWNAVQKNRSAGVFEPR